jgi:hypothetical protein
MAALVCVLLSGLAWWLSAPRSAETGRATALIGERWYALTLDERHLGYLHTHNFRDEQGNWVFESEQRFAMNPYDPAATTTRRVFANEPPYPLLRAEHLQTRRGQVEGVRIEIADGGYQAIRLPEDGVAATRLSWRYDLTDYLGFELWLAREHPAPGRSRSVMTLDFDRLEPVRRTFEVVADGSEGYTIENGAPFSATRIQLDEQFAPVAMRIAGLFNLRLASRNDALAPRSTLQAASYHIPTDRQLPDHTRINQLTLAIEGHDSPRVLFPEAVQSEEGQWTLTLTHRKAIPSAAGREFSAETLQIPSDHPHIRSLALEAAGDGDNDAARARALNRFVHGFLSYRPGRPPQSVLSLLEDRVGDCTEFADLLTTLARSIGLPARTVFGLAYADGQEPAFAYHAWNEIHVEGEWRSFDPTWGQDRVDATHIPLPNDETAAMMLLTGAVSLRFKVLDFGFFPD